MEYDDLTVKRFAKESLRLQRNFSSHYYERTNKVRITIDDPEGTYTFPLLDGDIAEIIAAQLKEIFLHYEEPYLWSIIYHEEIVREHLYFSGGEFSKGFNTWKQNSISYREYAAAKEKKKQARYQRYAAACDWARDHGAKIRSGKGIKRETLSFRVVEACIENEFNELFPEFEISEGLIDQYRNYLKVKR